MKYSGSQIFSYYYSMIAMRVTVGILEITGELFHPQMLQLEK